MVYYEDVQTKIAKIMVAVYATKEKIDKIIEFKNNKFSNYIALNTDEINIILKDATLVNDPEITFGNDGQAELEIHGRQVDA